MASPMENNTKYHNWIKRSLALLYLKEGIAEEVNQKAAELQNKIKQDVSRNCLSAVTSTCQSNCTSKYFKKTSHNTRWTINCASNVCNYWLDELIKIHEHRPCPDVKWVNCDPTLWPRQPWEVAKVFQPIGCATHRNAEDSDIAALLTFMLNCKFFDNRILPNKSTILKELKEIRNFTMHSATLEVEDADLVASLEKMIALLEDPPHFCLLPACKTAAVKIRELKNKPMTMSFNKDDEQTALSQRVASLRSEVSSLTHATNEMRGEIDDIGKQNLDEMKRNITSARTDIDELKKEVNTLKGLDVPQLQNKLPELEDQLIETSRQFCELRTKFDDRICVLECEMAVAKSVLSQVKERSELNTETIKNVERKMESELSSVKQKAEKKQTEEDTLLTDTQKRLISLYDRHDQKVPVYPLHPEDREHVQQLYVKPSMEEMNPQGMQGLTEQGNDTKKEVKLKDIRDIFFSGEKSFKNIYLVAEAGSGKSTLCEFLVYLWVKEHSAKENKGERGFMEEFALLFYISLREANSYSTSDIEAMIRKQLELNLDEEDMSTLILEYTCLIILDGLDEYSLKHSRGTRNISASLPWRRHSAKCTIITTSRPWKLELLASELGGHIDRQIRITGLESESQEDLAEIVITLLNSKRGHVKNFKDFISDMKKQQLDKYMETPILLLQMLGLWFDGESFGNSQCEIYAKIIEQQIKFVAEVKNNSAASNAGKEPHSETKPNKRGLLHKLSRFAPRNLFGKHHDKLPACFNDQSYCQTYQGLLLKVSKLAYHLLFDSQNSVLVFDHDQKEISGPCRLSEEEIQTCLDLGLLTQYKVLEKVTQRQKSISFVHKSHQEFFAAVCLWQSSDLRQLLDSFTDLGRAFQIEKVLTFVSAMSPEVSSEIANVVIGLRSSDDPTIKEYRESCSNYAPQTSIVKHIQGLILTAIEESKQRRSMPFLLQDIWMSGYDRDFRPSRILACSQSLQLSHVRSIYIESPSDREECEKIWQLVKNASQQLHKLVLYDCDINVSVLQEVVKRNKDSLQVIGLYKVRNFSLLDEATLTWIVSANSLALSGYPVSRIELTHEQVEFVYKHLGQRPHTQVVLEYLRCKLHDDSCEPQQRLDLTSSRQLHTLKLRDLRVQEVFVPDSLLHCEIDGLPVQRLDLTSSRQLHTLKLSNLQVQRLDLTSSRQLHTLKLSNLQVQRLDLTSSRQLHTLKLRNLRVQEVFVPDSLLHCEICEILDMSDVVTASIVRSLRDARSLHTFDCCNDGISATVNQEIVTTLPQLEALRKIELWRIDMTCTQQHVFPDHMKALEEIKLWYVTMRATQLRELLAALPSHRVDVDLRGVTLTDYDRNDDIIEQTAASPRTQVMEDARVTYKHDKCFVTGFKFYHTK